MDGEPRGVVPAVLQPTEPVDEPNLTIAIVLGARVSWLVASPLGLFAAIDAGAPIVRPRFVVESGGTEQTVYEASPLFVGGELGVFVAF